ncbi:MAG: DoxX family protein [Phycisphaerae bacterium]
MEDQPKLPEPSPKIAPLDVGLLVLRVGVGLSFVIFHGWPKMKEGPVAWEQLGSNMALIGITFLPWVWGFLAAFAEFVGGIMLAVGLFVRPFAFMLAFVMLIAMLRHYNAGQKYTYPLEMGFVFLALLIGGGGKLVLSNVIGPLKGRCWT